MTRPKTTDKLPDSPSFWDAVDNDPTKDFHNAVVLDMIRSFNSDETTHMLQFIAKLKLLVDLMDLPADAFAAIQRKKALNEQEESLADALSED